MRVMEVGLAMLFTLAIFGGLSLLESFAQEGENTIEEPAQETIEEPAQGTIEEPAQETIEEPVEETVEEPAQETIEEPVEETVEEPAQETIEESVEETIEEPAQETIEEPVDETIEEQVVQQNVQEPVDETIEEQVVQQNVQEPVEEILKVPIVQQKAKEPVENSIEESAVQTENELVVEESNSKRKVIKEKIQEKFLKNELISEGSKKIQSEKRVIILYKEKIKNFDMDDLKLKKAKIDRMLDKSNAVAVTIHEKYLDEIKSKPNVIGVMSQTLVHASLGPSDSGVLEIIKANQVHDNLSTGNGVKVCVIDTGIDHSHPDFQGVPILYEFDFENNDSDASDDEGHGTHVTATIASKSASHRGVAPGVTLYIAKVLDENGSGTFSSVANAIDWCADGP